MADGFEQLMNTISVSVKHYNTEKIQKAYDIANMLHEGQILPF